MPRVFTKDLGERGYIYGDAHTTNGDLHFKNKAKKTLPISSIPLAVYSEVLRDIDLFISVAGLYIDPQNNEDQHPLAEKHWNQSCEVRKQLLDKILSSMGINNYEWNKPFLRLNSSEKVWLIHIGTGHVFDENGQYDFKCKNERSRKRARFHFYHQ